MEPPDGAAEQASRREASPPKQDLMVEGQVATGSNRAAGSSSGSMAPSASGARKAHLQVDPGHKSDLENPLLEGIQKPSMEGFESKSSMRSRTSSAAVDSQGLKQVKFHTGSKEMEVQTFESLGKGADKVASQPGARRCCLAALCAELCEVLRDRPVEEPEDVVEDDAFDESTIDWKHSRTAYDGYLWKLNSDKAEEDIGDINNWRRRQFYLQRTAEKLAIMYTSEKENGVLQVSCLLASSDEKAPVPTATVSTLKVQPVNPMPEDLRNKVINDLQTYDTAFGQKRFEYDYGRDLPESFHPFLIEWYNEEGEKTNLVLSGGNERMSQRWEQAIARALQQMKRHAGRRSSQKSGGPGT